MSEQKESSVLFSLKELMNLEEDRIKTEETSKAEQARQAEQARLDAERAAREAEEARIHAENEKRRLEESRQREETARLEAIRQGFEQAVSASPWVGPPLWCHGDIHPGNLILDRGELVGVIDFGDCCAGDPASDLAVCWWWFPAAEREAFQRSYDQALRRQQGEAAVEDADRWLRARGWAYALCLAVASNDKSSTAMRHSAEHALVEHLGCG